MQFIKKFMANQKEGSQKVNELKQNPLVKDYKTEISATSTAKAVIPKDITKDDVALIVYTGGTTGAPKGVKLTNQNINAMIHGVVYGAGDFRSDQVSMNILPPGIAFYYNSVLAFMCNGVKIDLISHFTEDNYPYLLDIHKPNIILSGPILLEKTYQANNINDASNLERVISGGDRLNVNEEENIVKFLAEKKALPIVHQGWGMSECCAVASYATTPSYKLGSVGIPLINYNVSIFEFNTDKELPYNQVGEICVNSKTVMQGYYNNEKASQNVIKKHSDGKLWLHSEDLGYIDEEGRLYYIGRNKRMLTRSGSKIWLSEIENIVEKHPQVLKCACVKYADEEEREVPVIHIVLENNADYDQIVAELTHQITTQMNDKSVPKYFIFREELPYNEVNKKIHYQKIEKENIYEFANLYGPITTSQIKLSLKKD